MFIECSTRIRDGGAETCYQTALSRVQAGTWRKITGVRRVHSETKCFLSAELTDKTKQNKISSYHMTDMLQLIRF